MEAHSLFLTTVITISFFLIMLPESLCEEDEQYLACKHPFNCGTLKDIRYPFWSDDGNRYCGSDGFGLYCQRDQTASIRVGSQNFSVLRIDPYSYTMTMVRTDLVIDNCSSRWTTTSLSTQLNLFRFDQNVKMVTLFYDCPSDILIGRNNFTCSDLPNKHVFYGDDTLLQQFSEIHRCERHIQVPVSKDTVLDPEDGIEARNRVLNDGFGVQYIIDGARCGECMGSGGFCGSNNKSEFTCHCPDGPHAAYCSDSGSKGLSRKQKKVIVGAVSSSVTVIVMIVIFYFYQRRKKTSYAKSYIQSRATFSDSSIMDTENGVHVFTYSELEEATNNFDSAKELGDGGFGTVYFGKLRDGRYVAVKRLYENNYKRVEQFINEVEILTRLRHTNLVSLYGCTSRHSRELLLVYEYIPNGTVADHLHGERAKPGSLPWNIRMNIAIETASALAYLHASEIIHRDVKTNNILLDNHFTVKVADFGLSRLFPENVTHISTVPQGTPGYVDPEYHECYQLTDKSDVYSFGVVLIELISSMPAVDITRHRHEINLSTMAIDKIQNRALHELVDPTLGFESDYKVRKMINAVAELAFQCLQNLKDMRPCMEEVLETLKDIESDGKHPSKPEVMDILADDAVLLKNDLPPLSPDSNFASKSTTPNASN